MWGCALAKQTKADTDLLAEARERYKFAQDWWKDNFEAWLEDAKFRALDQWPEEVRRLRSLPGKERPCLVVDKLNQYVKQVVNDGRQNRPAVKVLPVDDKGDDDVADAFQGFIRSICNRSRADEAFDTALDHSAGNGFGYFRVLTEYAHKGTFNQEIVIKRVRNPLTVLLDPNIQAADGSDACFGFVTEDVPKDKFKYRYPNAKVTDWESDQTKFGEGWADGKTVRVCEYWYKLEAPITLHRLVTGEEISDEDYQLKLANLAEGEPPPKIDETREVPGYQVKFCRMTGAEILERQDWLGQHIPLVPVFGNESDIDGKVMYSGLIRAGKDPQRLYNFSRSAFAERVAYTPKAPWLAAAESIEGIGEWATANTGNHQVLTFNAFGPDNEKLPIPQRINPADVPAGFAQDMQLAEHDIQAALGMYNASLGEKSNEKSGKAIMARQREGDTATFHYQDNLNRAISYLGRILIDLIPKIYDSKRVVRILGEDGKASQAMIDPESPQPLVEYGGQKIYNLGVGTYDVTVTAGPSYTTKRQEAAEAQVQIAQAVPQLWQVGGDIIIRNMDWPGSDELADRWKKMLPPGIADDESSENPEAAAIKQQAQQMLDQASAQIEQAKQIIAELQSENEGLKQQAANKMAEVDVKRSEAETGAYEAETARMQALAPAITPEAITAIVQQTVQEILKAPPPPMAAPIDQPPPGGFFTP